MMGIQEEAGEQVLALVMHELGTPAVRSSIGRSALMPSGDSSSGELIVQTWLTRVVRLMRTCHVTNQSPCDICADLVVHSISSFQVRERSG